MNTKLSVALLSGFSFFMSVAAFAIADEKPEDYLNWSYAMGDIPQNEITKDITTTDFIDPVSDKQPTCTEGCLDRSSTDNESIALTLTYEEDAPIADQREVDNNSVADITPPVMVKTKTKAVAYSKPTTKWNEYTYSEPTLSQNQIESTVKNAVLPQSEAQIETRYVTTPKIQYPITRQYPVSVEYPVTVQRNMTVEQPVIVQQPVVVRRPVVMQQDITVQRQPTVVQNQPVVMNQQPTLIHQQPMYIQAPAQPIPQAMMTQIMPQVIPTNLQQQLINQQPMFLQPQQMVIPQTVTMNAPQQYQIQGQVQAQPVYMMPNLSYTGQSVMPAAVQPSAPQQQPIYPNQIQ